ncbi:hypothetical protein GCM10007387_49150 [Pseudoduganella albidiflava]|uniref:4-aminobutyrate aminotransferase n=1 Tax=Pseudoduganella albidiflava TaxID=321983 RepID=A0AA88C502_9BURK|nr:hypothetical protein GCM10007387_49150 [Pseudoduganella albidiflava]
MALNGAVAAEGVPADGVPPDVRDGLASLHGGHGGRLFFAPVRHHSPACALAVRELIREVRPAAVLVEGPDDFDALLPALLDGATRPPVAILSLAPRPGGGSRPAFFPFCDYSPEWVALRAGADAGARLAFIDQPWTARAADDTDTAAHTLMAERHLAHSTYLKALAARSGCRAQDDLWDHLFELRGPVALRDWRTLLADVYAYCAMARHDYEPQVLEAEGSLPRERHMAAHIRRHLQETNGAIVVVTGGFHTPGLQAMLAEPLAAPKAAPAASPPRPRGAAGSGNWLIRYSFDHLDALNGYAAGMPAPGWYQRVWNSAVDDPAGPALHEVAAACLAELARETRTLGLAEQVSTADVGAAVLQAGRLAALRGHAGPGREDVLDAIRSCFVKGALGDGMAGFDADVRRLLCGHALGDIPATAAVPPLVDDARRLAARLGVRLDDSAPRTVRLDIYRDEGHRERSRFLHLADWLGLELAQWRGGPDFLAGTRLELLIEEWQVAWTPLVEARLVALSAEGATLQDVALARLRRDEAALAERGLARSAGAAAGLLTRGCLVGLHERLPDLLAMVAARLDEDGAPASVIAGCHQLLALWRAREPLGVKDDPALHALLLRAWDAALYLLPQLADTAREGEEAAIGSLLSLRAFRHALAHAAAGGDANDGDSKDDDNKDDDNKDDDGAGRWARVLAALVTAPRAAPGIASAAAVLLFLDGAWSEERLCAVLAATLGPGAERDDAARALQGLLAAGPELLLTQPALRQAVDTVMASWDERTFLRHLPDLRHAFTRLKPAETAQLAAALAVADDAGLGWQGELEASEADMLAGAALHADLLAVLARDGLQSWTRTSATTTPGTITSGTITSATTTPGTEKPRTGEAVTGGEP